MSSDDLDIYVVTPGGFTISYIAVSDPESVGQLDKDDMRLDFTLKILSFLLMAQHHQGRINSTCTTTINKGPNLVAGNFLSL